MHKIFHSSAKLIANDSEIDKVFGSFHQSVMTRIKCFVSEDWFVKTIVKHSITIFKCWCRQK